MPRPRLKPNAVFAQRVYASQQAGAAGVAEKSGERNEPAQILEHDRKRTRHLAMALHEAHKRAAKRADGSRSQGLTESAPPPAGLASRSVKPPEQEAPTARRFLLTASEQSFNLTPPVTIKPFDSATVEAVLSIAPTNTNDEQRATSYDQRVHDELTEIRQMVGQVLHRQAHSTPHPTTELPRHLLEMYLQLISQDVSDELASQIISAVRSDLDDEDFDDEDKVRQTVLRHLAELIPIAQGAPPGRAADGRPRTVALVGPTGVGKTTTVAKLAASFKLRHGQSVGLITCDTYRIAAVDQLRTYADIVGLPLHVALSPAEVAQALAALHGCDVVLIDTAGRSQNDQGRLDELSRFIQAANPHEVHLVLSSTAGQRVLLNEAEAFSRIGVHKIVFSKLDEAVSFGILVNVIRQVGKELSFVTTGQEVPTHLEAGRADRLAELVLGARLGSETVK